MSPFELGKIDGIWTGGDVSEVTGFPSVEVYLEHLEEMYQRELTSLPRLAAKNAVYAERHAQYLEGFFSSRRASLSALLREEKL